MILMSRFFLNHSFHSIISIIVQDCYPFRLHYDFNITRSRNHSFHSIIPIIVQDCYPFRLHYDFYKFNLQKVVWIIVNSSKIYRETF